MHERAEGNKEWKREDEEGQEEDIDEEDKEGEGGEMVL